MKYNLSCLIFHSKSERTKGIKLILKIFKKIISNRFELSKYGNLNFEKINEKLSNCKPAFELLFIVGFVARNVEDKQRLIWMNTPENMQQITDIAWILNMNTDEMDTFFALIEEGYSADEAMNGINLSQID